MLNAYLKAIINRGAPSRGMLDLKKAAISHLSWIQKSPSRLIRSFQHWPVRYGAGHKIIRF
jgi:hypothetical protein